MYQYEALIIIKTLCIDQYWSSSTIISWCVEERQKITVADVHANTYAGDGFHEPLEPLDSA